MPALEAKHEESEEEPETLVEVGNLIARGYYCHLEIETEVIYTKNWECCQKKKSTLSLWSVTFEHCSIIFGDNNIIGQLD